jgi:hypothetical protein
MAGDGPNFAESAEQNGTVPLSEAILLDAQSHVSQTVLHTRFSPGQTRTPT